MYINIKIKYILKTKLWLRPLYYNDKNIIIF